MVDLELDDLGGTVIARMESVDALGFLQSIYRDPRQPEARRLKAAIEALPFEKPKLAAVANLNANGVEFATELETRRMARGRLIEAKPNGSQVGSSEPRQSEVVSAEHLTKGFQSLRRRPL